MCLNTKNTQYIFGLLTLFSFLISKNDIYIYIYINKATLCMKSIEQTKKNKKRKTKRNKGKPNKRKITKKKGNKEKKGGDH